MLINAFNVVSSVEMVSLKQWHKFLWQKQTQMSWKENNSQRKLYQQRFAPVHFRKLYKIFFFLSLQDRKQTDVVSTL